MTIPKLYTREFLGVNLFIFLIFMNLSYFVLLPLYLTELGVGETIIGLIMGIYAFANFIVKPLMGGILQRFGRKNLMLWGALITLVASSLYGPASGMVSLIFGIRILHGLGVAFCMVASLAVIGQIVPVSRLGEGYNMASLMMILPMSFAPVVGERIIGGWGFGTFWFFPPVTVGLALMLVIILWPALPVQPSSQEHKTPRWLEAEVFRDPWMIGAMLAVFLAFMGQASINNLVALLAEDRGLKASDYFVSYSLAIVVFRLMLGRFFDREHQRRIVTGALTIWVVGCCTLWLAYGQLTMGLAGLIMGAGFFPVYPILNALIMRRSSPSHSDNNLSLFTASTDLGFLLGPVVFGAVIKHFGFSWFIGGAALMGGLANLVWSMTSRSMHRAEVKAASHSE